MSETYYACIFYGTTMPVVGPSLSYGGFFHEWWPA